MTLMGLDEKYARLQETLRSLGRVAVAFSGGVDSTFLMRVAHDVLGKNALAVTASSESYPVEEFRMARELARSMGARQIVIQTRESGDPDYARNAPDRCYFCKSELFDEMAKVAEREGIPHILDGSNADDTGDYRPGSRAAGERGVKSPLRDCGLAKEEIRELSRRLGLPTWNRPASPCLSSRIPYGSAITNEKLREVEAAERVLREAGFEEVRVRHHGPIARIEIPVAGFDRLLDPGLRDTVIGELRKIGFVYVTLDLRGFRSGSMNEVLPRTASGNFVPVEDVSVLGTRDAEPPGGARPKPPRAEVDPE